MTPLVQYGAANAITCAAKAGVFKRSRRGLLGFREERSITWITHPSPVHLGGESGSFERSRNISSRSERCEELTLIESWSEFA